MVDDLCQVHVFKGRATVCFFQLHLGHLFPGDPLRMNSFQRIRQVVATTQIENCIEYRLLLGLEATGTQLHTTYQSQHFCAL
jgi:hypothetical protein